MAYLFLEETKLFKYNSYDVSFTMTKPYIDYHFANGVSHSYIYSQLLAMKTCCVTKTGYSLITCPVCCKNKKKSACTAALDAALPPIVSVTENQKVPDVLEDGSLKYTVSIKPICSSSRNHLHTNIFLAANIGNELFVSKCFSLLARKFQSKAKKLIKDDSVAPKKRGRPLNSVNKEHKEKVMKLSNNEEAQINPLYFSYSVNVPQIQDFNTQPDFNDCYNLSPVDSLSEISDEISNSSEFENIESNEIYNSNTEQNFDNDFFFNTFDNEKESITYFDNLPFEDFLYNEL